MMFKTICNSALSAFFVLPATCIGAETTCWQSAGLKHGIDPWLLYGIAKVESSLNTNAMNLTHQKRTGSYDIGLMQINSRNLKGLAQFGINEAALSDPCVNIEVGAYILAEKMRVHGNTWDAVGAYNAACTQLKGNDCLRARRVYAWKVYRAIQQAKKEAV
jgi:soluble lytic murein transglycosylase-like protein